MRLLMTLQSVRLCAFATSGTRMVRASRGRRNRSMDFSLLVTQRLYGIETRSARRRVKTRNQADDKRKNDGCPDQPPRHRPEGFGRERLALQINIGPQVDDVADGPAQQYSHHPA